MKRFLILIGTLALLVQFGCPAKSRDETEDREGPKYKSSNFIERIEKFPYDAPPSRNEKLLNGFQKLSLQMKKQDVLPLLGEPDSEELSFNKTKGDLFLGSSWGYYLHRHEARLDNEANDKTIFIYFDKDGQLYWALPKNVQGLSMIGSPVQRTSK